MATNSTERARLLRIIRTLNSVNARLADVEAGLVEAKHALVWGDDSRIGDSFLDFLGEHPELDELSDRVMDELIDEGVDLWPEGRDDG